MFTTAFILVGLFILVQSHVDKPLMTLPNFEKTDQLKDYFDIVFKFCDFTQRHLNVDKIKMAVYDFSTGKRLMLPLSETADYIFKNMKISGYNWVIYVPGFNYEVNVNDGGSPEMLKAMSRLKNTHYIVLNHNDYTYVGYEGYALSYLRAIRYMYSIAGALANFIDMLTRKVDLSRIRFIGHSLGGQIIGQAGFIYRNNTKKSFERIIGLDPAGPCFWSMALAPAADHAHIRSGAAKRVEVFHCNSGVFGTTGAYADADYFYNSNGVVQPGCDKLSVTEQNQCSHSMCPVIYAASVKNATWYPTVETSEDGTTISSGFWSTLHEGVYRVMTDQYSLDP